jgi:hypothetical protein
MAEEQYRSVIRRSATSEIPMSATKKNRKSEGEETGTEPSGSLKGKDY